MDGGRRMGSRRRYSSCGGGTLILAEELAEPSRSPAAWHGRRAHVLADRAHPPRPARPCDRARRSAGGNEDARVVLARLLAAGRPLRRRRAVSGRADRRSPRAGRSRVVGSTVLSCRARGRLGRTGTQQRLCDEAIELARQTGWDRMLPLCRNGPGPRSMPTGARPRKREREIPELLQVAAGRRVSGLRLSTRRVRSRRSSSRVGDADAAWSG